MRACVRACRACHCELLCGLNHCAPAAAGFVRSEFPRVRRVFAYTLFVRLAAFRRRRRRRHFKMTYSFVAIVCAMHMCECVCVLFLSVCVCARRQRCARSRRSAEMRHSNAFAPRPARRPTSYVACVRTCMCARLHARLRELKSSRVRARAYVK